jgi:FkbM family methyltransferase
VNESRPALPPRPTLAVCVVTYERPGFVRRCLDSLVAEPPDIDEIIVVDASRDDDGAAMARDYPTVRYLHVPELAGWMTRSRNEALRWVRSDLIAFIDDDVVVGEGWASALRSAFNGDASAVAGRTRNGIPGEETYPGPIGRLLPDGRLTAGFAARTEAPLPVDHGIGANMAFRRDVLADLGGFRDDYPGTALREDTDVFLRVRKLGGMAVFAPDAVVDHKPAPHVKGARFDTRYKLYGRRNHVVLLAREGGVGGRLLWRWIGGEIRSVLAAGGLRYSALKLGVTVAGIGWGLAVLPRYAGWRASRPERNDLVGRDIRQRLSPGLVATPPRGPQLTPTLTAPARLSSRAISGGREVVAVMARRLPRGVRGRERLLRLFDERIPRAHPMVIAPMKLGYRMHVDLRSRTEVFAYYTGHYDTPLIAAALRLLPPGGVAVDIGANVGFWTVPLAKKGRLYAYEPVPSNAARLRDNAALNSVQSALVVRQLAVSNTPAELCLTLREDFERGARTGNAAVVIDDADSGFETITIEANTLDNEARQLAWDRLDVLKLDIEGHEDLALMGGRKTLEKYRPVIFVEWNDSYYKRRKVNPSDRFARALAGLDYHYLRRTAAGWSEVPSFASPNSLDDLVLVPRTRLQETVAALSYVDAR